MNRNPNYQLSGIKPNYTYNGVQGLPFDSSSIPQSMPNTINDQRQFVINNSSFIPSTTFQRHETINAKMQNQRDFSQYNINKNFEQHTPLEYMQNTQYQNNTLYNNLNTELLKESIVEVRLNIDSSDRDLLAYPDPFTYVVKFGPLGTRNLLNTPPIYTNEYEKDIVVDYTTYITQKNDPYIERNFKNVKFIRLDNVVLPRFNCVKLNHNWNYCINTNHVHEYVKDDYERIKNKIIVNNRYIPDDNIFECNLFTDRFVQVYIKEIANSNNLGTNPVSTKAFTVFPDKQTGIMYWRGNPYYAVNIYKDSLLGNIDQLSIEFYNSWGKQITLNTSLINFEWKHVAKTALIKLGSIDINKAYDNHNYRSVVIDKLSDIIKTFTIINYNIKCKIPFCVDHDVDYDNTTCDDMFDFDKIYTNINTIIVNECEFVVHDIFNELNEFVTDKSFVQVNKKLKNGKYNNVNIDNYIKNVVWYNYSEHHLDKIIYNIDVLMKNYKQFGYNILHKLKTEITELPLNKYFQNHLTFVMGTFVNELNTKIDYSV